MYFLLKPNMTTHLKSVSRRHGKPLSYLYNPIPRCALTLRAILSLTLLLIASTVVLAEDECYEPLLSQARLTASSEYGRFRGADAAQLDSTSAWTAGQSDFSQYLIVDLGKKFNVTSVATQGRAYASEYVMEYRIDYGYDGQDFAPYRDKNGNVKIFEANANDKGTVENKFDAPLIAQYIRINPTRWHNRISMRVQIYGCSYSPEVLGFDGQSMILLNLRKRPVDAYEDHLQFRFRTPYADASLLYANGDEGDVMAVQLINNKLIYSLNLGGSGKVQNISAGSLLDDNTWHDVSIDRYGKSVILSVDRVVVKEQLGGEFSRLNINLDLWIGGLPTLLYDEVLVRTNFTGCIENLMFNTTNVGSELKEDPNGYLYTTFGYIYHYCLHQPTQSITFMTNESYFKVEGYQLQLINCSLDFRTFVDSGVILYSKFSLGGAITLSLRDGKFVTTIQDDKELMVDIEPSEKELNDGSWRYGKSVILSVDRVVVKEQLGGEFSRLNINLDLWIGGLPTLLYDEVLVRTNFTGCIENLMFNTTNVGSELKEDPNGYLYTTFGYIYHYCLHQPTQSITFMTNESYFKVEGYQLQLINCSLDFRTFVDSGVILYSKFSLGGAITLSLRDGKFVTTIQDDKELMVDIEPSEKELNDGSWHSIRVLSKENLIILTVDDEVSVTKRRFRFESGREYYLGGVPDNRPGLIGCMRYVHIEGRYVSLGSLPSDRMHRNQPGDIVVDACRMIDRCHPNPCEHGGACRQNQLEFSCDCSKTGYLGAVCHVSKHPHSCEAYRIDFPKEKEKEIYLDVDGSGPLEPFLVFCRFIPKGPTQTILHHRSESEIVVQGYEGRGSYIRSIDYYAPLESIRIITERSTSCNQFIKYSCLNARLFNAGLSREMFDPHSWWVGSNNQKMDYWGGSLPGTGMCACGLDGSCKDPTKGCNCDAILAYNTNELADEGLLTQKEYLPVKEVHIGDTGTSLTSNKRAKINLGPLVCEGDALFSEAITFKYDDASIPVMNVMMGGASDIYLQFKTTIASGVFLHGKGLHDDIKLSIINEKTIQFSFSNGRDMQPLTIEAPYRLNDNNWHSISVERNKKEAKLVVDGQISSNVASRHATARSSSTTIHLFVGATEDFKEGYVGCMRSLLINGKAIDIYTPAQEGKYGLVLGCHGKCETNPCLNKGVCQEGYSSFTCDCQWTAYKGPICADEIGANLRSDNYVRYDFDTSLSTVEENIRVGFTTTEHKGLIIGVTSHTGEYLNLLMSTSGHLKLEFDFGFERKEEVINLENFALGQHHDITIKRALEGSKLIVGVDNYEPKVYQYKISKEADAKFDQLKSIYLGRNETMDSGDGFVGCISHVSFDDHFPLRFLFQEGRKTNVHAFPPDDSIKEDTCGIEPIRPPPEARESRPSAKLRETPGRVVEVVYHSLKFVMPFVILVAAFVSMVLYARWKSAEKGDYMTHEDIGAKEALDPDSAVMMGVTGPMISKGQEYYV